MENPVKMDDLGVPLFLETPIICFTNYLCFTSIIYCYLIYCTLAWLCIHRASFWPIDKHWTSLLGVFKYDPHSQKLFVDLDFQFRLLVIYYLHLFATCLLGNFWHRFLFLTDTNSWDPLGPEKAARRGAAMAAGEVEDFGGAKATLDRGNAITPGWQEPKKMWSMLIFFCTNVVNARFGVEQKVKYHKVSCIICIHVFTFLDGKEFLILMQEIQSRKEEADRQSAILQGPAALMLNRKRPWPMDDSWLLMDSRVLNL